MKVLITCPPMLRMIDSFRPLFAQHGAEITTPDVVQTLSVEQLKELVPQHDGWIIGDDPATREVFKAGKAGRLKAAVKWGIGVDNVDFAACKDLGIPIINTPNMFGGEVADIAVGYVIALARQTFDIDRGVRTGEWPKPRGISLAGKTVALVGYGDIGKNTARRLLAADMTVVAYDPYAPDDSAMPQVQRATWPQRINEADFIVINCALTPSSHHMLNAEVLAQCKPGVRVVNVGRGPIIDEPALEAALHSGQVFSAALDVFETEPLPMHSTALKVGDVVVRVDPRYSRPAEVETLLGDPTKAKTKLGWVPEITVQEMCTEMVAEDLKAAQRHSLLKRHGHEVAVAQER